MQCYAISAVCQDSVKYQACICSFIIYLFSQGPHMVTEELHSISFETQVCLYGLTINLEVSILDRFSVATTKNHFPFATYEQLCWASLVLSSAITISRCEISSTSGQRPIQICSNVLAILFRTWNTGSRGNFDMLWKTIHIAMQKL